MNVRKLTQLIGLGVIVYLSLQVAAIQTIIFFSRSSVNLHMEQNEISIYEKRFSIVKNELRSVNGDISYLSCPDLDIDLKTQHYFLTQYILTPLTIENNLDNPLILGNFPPQLCGISSINLKQNNLSIIQEYGNGLFLLKEGN